MTVEEHGRLNLTRGEDGWDRYRTAGIRVFDRQEQIWLDLEARTDSAAPAPPAIAPQAPATTLDVADAIAEHARPAPAPYLKRFLRTIRLVSAVASQSVTREGEVSDYFMVYDALIGERTPGVAYVHWTGKIDYRLVPEDLPRPILADPRILAEGREPYSIRLTVNDDSSFELAEDVLTLALEKLREELSTW